MVEFIHTLLGEYLPVTYEYIVNDTIVNVIPNGISGVDFSYIFSGLILCIIINSFFKALGGIICKIF